MRRAYVLALVLTAWLIFGGAGWAAAPATIKYGLVQPHPVTLPLQVARDRGIFDRHEVKLDIVMTGTSAAATQALIGGSVDLIGPTGDASFAAQRREPRIKHVAASAEGVIYSLLVVPEIKTVEALRDKTSGATTPKTGDAFYLRGIMDHHGLKDARDYTIIVAGPVAARAQAMLNRTVHFTVNAEPHLSYLTERGMVELVRGRDLPRFKEYLQMSVVGMQDWIRANEETLARFIRAWADAITFIYEPANKAEVMRIIGETAKVPEKYAASAYRVYVEEMKLYPPQGRLNLKALRGVYENFALLGDLQGPIPDPRDFVELGPWEKAMGRPSGLK